MRAVTTQHVYSLNEERNDSRIQSGSGETLSPSWLRDVFSINWTTGPPNPPKSHSLASSRNADTQSDPVPGPLTKLNSASAGFFRS